MTNQRSSSPEARLAAALHEGTYHNGRGGADDARDKAACIQMGWEKSRCMSKAAAILATDPTIARHMALGAAVEAADDKYFVIRRLPYLGTNYPPVWQVWRGDKDGIDHPVHTAPTLIQAINAALRDPEEADHES